MKRASIFISLTIVLILSGCSSSAPANTTPSVTPTGTPIQQQVATPVPQKQPTIEYAFTQNNQHPEKLLIDVMNSAKSTLDIAIYSITQPDIVKAIKDAKKRGVTVRIITDKTEAAGKTQAEALKLLAADKIPMKMNTHKGLMHLKVTIADNSVVTTGSYNYSTAASTTNDEVLVKISDPAIAKEWDAQFERMWNDTKGFADFK